MLDWGGGWGNDTEGRGPLAWSLPGWEAGGRKGYGVPLEKESAVRRRQSGEKGQERILGGKNHKIKIQKEGLDC